MYKNIFATEIRGDKAEALGGIEPLHGAGELDRRPIDRRRVCGSLRSGTPRLLLQCRASVDADDFGHLRPLRARRGADLECGTGRHAPVATTLDHAYMQECVARTIGYLNESKAF